MAFLQVGDSFAIAVKQFDQSTGEPVADKVAAIDLAQLKEEKVRLQSQINDIDVVIAECEGLKNDIDVVIAEEGLK